MGKAYWLRLYFAVFIRLKFLKTLVDFGPMLMKLVWAFGGWQRHQLPAMHQSFGNSVLQHVGVDRSLMCEGLRFIRGKRTVLENGPK